MLCSRVATRAGRYLPRRSSRNGNDEDVIICTRGFDFINIAGKCHLLPVRRFGIAVVATEIEGRNIVISRRDVDWNASFRGNNEQMAALKARVTRPMAVKKTRKCLRFHLGFSIFFVTNLVTSVIFAVGIHLRDEQNVLAIARPNRSISLCGQRSKLTRLPRWRSGSAIEAFNPYLRAANSA